MKRILLSVFSVSTVLLSAQTLLSGDLNSLTSGDVGANFAFGAPGQDGFYLSGGSAPDYQIVTVDATHGKSFQVTSGLGGTAASIRQVAKAGVKALWDERTAGNNIVRGKMDLYTGAPALGAAADQFRNNITGLLTGTGTTTGTLAGIYYNYMDGKIYGHASLKNGAAYGFYFFALGATSIPANTWVTLSYYYNNTTGQVNWVTPDGNYNFAGAANVVVGSYPTQYNFAYVPTTTTALTQPYVSAFDNYAVEATNTATLAVGTPVSDKDIVLKIYPNPVVNYINVESKNKVNSVQIFDISGKQVLDLPENKSSKIDLQSLTKGSYIIKVNTEVGSFSEKIIKQ